MINTDSIMYFYVRVVKDGDRIGWLLGKRQNQEKPIWWKYFFLKEGALYPNSRILEICPDLHEIMSSAHSTLLERISHAIIANQTG